MKRKTSRARIVVSLIILACLFGAAVWIAHHMYNKENVVAEDTNGNGQMNQWTYFDVRGHILRFEKDKDDNGVTDWRDFYTYDEGSKQPRMVRSEADMDYNGTFETTVYYNERQEFNRIERDNNDDGKVDAISIFKEPGRPPIKVKMDKDFDGEFEEIREREETY